MADNTKLVNTLNIDSADYRIAEHPYLYEYLPTDGDTFLLNICEISTDAIYLNHVIVIDVLGRDKNPVRLRIKFVSQNATDAPLDSFTIEGSGNPFYMKKMTSKTWVLWAECESWQRMSVIGFKCCDGVKSRITWNMSKTDISAKESFKTDWTQASAYYVPNAAYATSAGRATNATNATSATKATQDASGNVITSTYISVNDFVEAGLNADYADVSATVIATASEAKAIASGKQNKIESITHNDDSVDIDVDDATGGFTIDAATTSHAGVMSKADKLKLNDCRVALDVTTLFTGASGVALSAQEFWKHTLFCLHNGGYHSVNFCNYSGSTYILFFDKISFTTAKVTRYYVICSFTNNTLTVTTATASLTL